MISELFKESNLHNAIISDDAMLLDPSLLSRDDLFASRDDAHRDLMTVAMFLAHRHGVCHDIRSVCNCACSLFSS